MTKDVDKVAKTALEYREVTKKLERILSKAGKKSTRYRKLFNSKTLNLVEDLSIPATTRLIVKGELQNLKKNPYERSWTLDDKIFWLSFYKRSPKAYHFLWRYITPPSASCLKVLLPRICVKPGVIAPCLSILKDIVSKLSLKDTLCVIIFLRGHL
ncbi:uncharacterized protein LOC127749143 [Frankliniella occidentalis]|uniref:Uncharacterized protein LOC127749143 n=1 Tax=Frankliniella occidentalis TaxID=133901 RepID=A0A9C6WUV6_FRAOC|nr:uncharacterized protein LOC127749143 [Frankliniella occidentalis]